MSTLELKAEIHRKIDALDNIGELIDVNQSLDFFMKEKLTTEEHLVLNRLEKAKVTAEQGKGIPRDVVAQEAKSWLKR